MRNPSIITHCSAYGILVVLVEGSTNIVSLVNYAYQHRDVWVEHACIMYDLTLLDPEALTSAAIKNIPELFAKITEQRVGGRTALLVQKDLELIAKFVVAQSETAHGRIEIRTFCTKVDAISWLRAI